MKCRSVKHVFIVDATRLRFGLCSFLRRPRRYGLYLLVCPTRMFSMVVRPLLGVTGWRHGGVVQYGRHAEGQANIPRHTPVQHGEETYAIIPLRYHDTIRL